MSRARWLLTLLCVAACRPAEAPSTVAPTASGSHARPGALDGGPAPTAVAPAASPAPAPRRYTCPMHRGYVVDKPGTCPMCGMKLVPVPTDEPARPAHGGPHAHDAPPPPPSAGEVIDTQARRLPALRTVVVGHRSLGGELRAIGRVAIDERRVVRVQPRFEGFVERLPGLFVGKSVRRGELLADVYSPDLLAAQQELLLAQRGAPALAGAGLPEGAAAAEEKLVLLGMPRAEIAAVKKSGTPRRTVALRAPRAGVITVKNVVAGGKVGPDTVAFEITDLSHLWVLADVYEAELPWLRRGQEARVTLSYWPGRAWQGKVTFIAPLVDDKTRTVRVRVELPNPRGELRPEMFADVVLQGAARDALAVPEDSLVDTGARTVVFLDAGQGRVEQREVKLGTRAGGFVEVREGLRDGDRVAVGASFLLDSESRLRATSGAGSAP